MFPIRTIQGVRLPNYNTIRTLLIGEMVVGGEVYSISGLAYDDRLGGALVAGRAKRIGETSPPLSP